MLETFHFFFFLCVWLLFGRFLSSVINFCCFLHSPELLVMILYFLNIHTILPQMSNGLNSCIFQQLWRLSNERVCTW